MKMFDLNLIKIATGETLLGIVVEETDAAVRMQDPLEIVYEKDPTGNKIDSTLWFPLTFVPNRVMIGKSSVIAEVGLENCRFQLLLLYFNHVARHKKNIPLGKLVVKLIEKLNSGEIKEIDAERNLFEFNKFSSENEHGEIDREIVEAYWEKSLGNATLH